MGQTLVLQDWTTLTVPAAASIIQGEYAYLDIGGFQDIEVLFEVAHASGGSAPDLFVETSPTKESRLFRTLVTPTGPFPVTETQTARWGAGAVVNPARWLRWRVASSAGVESITFRILVNANDVAGHGGAIGGGGMPGVSVSSLRAGHG